MHMNLGLDAVERGGCAKVIMARVDCKKAFEASQWECIAQVSREAVWSISGTQGRRDKVLLREQEPFRQLRVVEKVTSKCATGNESREGQGQERL